MMEKLCWSVFALGCGFLLGTVAWVLLHRLGRPKTCEQYDIMREAIAAVQHEIWSHWMRYLFSECAPMGLEGEAVIISDAKAKRWKRQMGTPYDELSEKEKEGDRHQADKVMAEMWRLITQR